MTPQHPCHNETHAARGAGRATGAESSDLSYLNLYRVYRRTLTPEEDSALHLVEQAGLGYSEAAERLGTNRRHLSQLVFCARQKLLSGMVRTLTDLERSEANTADAR